MPESPGRHQTPRTTNLGSFFRNLGARGRSTSNFSGNLSAGSSATSTPAAKPETAADKLHSILGVRTSVDEPSGTFKPNSPTAAVVESLLHSLDEQAKQPVWPKRVGHAIRTDAEADVSAFWQKCETLLDTNRPKEVCAAGLELLKTCINVTNENPGSLSYPYDRLVYYNAARQYFANLNDATLSDLQNLVAVLEALTRGGRDLQGLDGIVPLLLDIAVLLTNLRNYERSRFIEHPETSSSPLLDANFNTPFIRLPPDNLQITSDPRYSPASLLIACHRFSFAQLHANHLNATMALFVGRGLITLGEHEISKILDLMDTVVKFGYVPEAHLEPVVDFIARVIGLEGRVPMVDISPDGKRRTSVLQDGLPGQAHVVMRHLLRSPANQVLKHLRGTLTMPTTNEDGNERTCPKPLLVGTLRTLRKSYADFEESNNTPEAVERSSEYWPSLMAQGMLILRDNLLACLRWRSEDIDSEVLLFMYEQLVYRTAENASFTMQEWEMLISILEGCVWHIETWEARHGRPWTIENAVNPGEPPQRLMCRTTNADPTASARKMPLASSKADAAPATLTTSASAEVSEAFGVIPVLTSFSLVINRMLAAQSGENFRGSHLRFYDFLLTIARHLNSSAIVSFFNFYQVRSLGSPGREDWVRRLQNIVTVFFPATPYNLMSESVKLGRRSAIQLLRDGFTTANGFPEYLSYLLDNVLYNFFEEHLPREEDPHVLTPTFSLLDRIMQEAIRDIHHGERPRKRADRLLGIIVKMTWQSTTETDGLRRGDSIASRSGSSPDRRISKATEGGADVGLSAARSLVYAFFQCIVASNSWSAAFAIRIIRHMLALVKPGSLSPNGQRASTKVQLTIWQCLIRLRADQRHRVFSRRNLDFGALAEGIGRLVPKDATPAPLAEVQAVKAAERERGRRTGQKDGEKDGDLNNSRRKVGSRSRNRGNGSPPPVARPAPGLWLYPETLYFQYPQAAVKPIGSQGLASFDHIRLRDWSESAEEGGSLPLAEGIPAMETGQEELVVLPVSEYLSTVMQCLTQETNWEVMSYLLCAFPAQLANKHFACGPRAAKQVQDLRKLLCELLNKDTFGQQVADLPAHVRKTDMHAIVYQWLATIIAYRDLFTREQQNEVVVTFTRGLSKTPNIAKPSIHAMTMACYEFESSMSKYLPDILAALVRIMSTVNMPVHILELVASIGHIRSLYANFTEDDYKKVFALAVQYLSSHYENIQDDPASAIVPDDLNKAIAHAFKQYVFLLSYYVITLWYTIVPVADRPRYTSFIVQRLLRANEGSKQLDPAMHVSLDMLARLAYSETTPFALPTGQSAGNSHESPICNQSWMIGHSILTLEGVQGERKALLTIRRPSGIARQTIQLQEPLNSECNILKALLGSRDSLQGPRQIAIEAPTNADPPIFDADPAFFTLFLPPHSHINEHGPPLLVKASEQSKRMLSVLDTMPHIDFHKIGVVYVGPGQKEEVEILRNMHGSRSYAKFLDGLGKLTRLKDTDMYTGGLDREADFDGKYAYIWSDQIQQMIFHVVTLMPTRVDTDPNCNYKKRHIGNDYVKIIYNDSGKRTALDLIPSQFNFVNIIIEPHTPAGEAWRGAAGISSNTEFFRVSMQQRTDMPEIGPLGIFKMVSTTSLPAVIRELALHANLFAQLFLQSVGMEGRSANRQKIEYTSTWRNRLRTSFSHVFPEDLAHFDPPTTSTYSTFQRYRGQISRREQGRRGNGVAMSLLDCLCVVVPFEHVVC